MSSEYMENEIENIIMEKDIQINELFEKIANMNQLLQRKSE